MQMDFRERWLIGAEGVVERRRNAVEFVDDEVVADAVEVFGGHAGFDMLADHLQHARRQSSGGARSMGQLAPTGEAGLRQVAPLALFAPGRPP